MTQIEQSPQPYITKAKNPEIPIIPAPFMLVSERSRRPLATSDVLSFHIPSSLQQSHGLAALTITFARSGFPTFYAYEQPIGPIATITIQAQNFNVSLPWGKYLNTNTNEEFMVVPALQTLFRKDSKGYKWLWDKTSGLCFSPDDVSLNGQGWELMYTQFNPLS